jgi:hypothetical protein
MRLTPDEEFVLVCQQPLDWLLDPPVQNKSHLTFLGVKPDHLESELYNVFTLRLPLRYNKLARLSLESIFD